MFPFEGTGGHGGPRTGHREGFYITKRDVMSYEEEVAMLWTIFVILVILWLLGLVSGYTIGGFIHVLLVLAIVVVLIRVISGRRPV